MAETKKIRKPSDLYNLSNDKDHKPAFDHSKVTAEDLSFIRRVLSN